MRSRTPAPMMGERLDQVHTRRRVGKGETSYAVSDGEPAIGQGDPLVVERRFVTPASRKVPVAVSLQVNRFCRRLSCSNSGPLPRRLRFGLYFLGHRPWRHWTQSCANFFDPEE